MPRYTFKLFAAIQWPGHMDLGEQQYVLDTLARKFGALAQAELNARAHLKPLVVYSDPPIAKPARFRKDYAALRKASYKKTYVRKTRGAQFKRPKPRKTA